MNFFEKAQEFFEKAVSSLESQTPFACVALTFFFAVTLRNFLETFSAHTPFSAEIFAHYYLFYISLAVSLILLFWLATKERVQKIARVILPSFIVLNVVPIIDLALTQGKGHAITYFIPGMHDDLLARFFLFTGEFTEWGITPGVKAEGAIVLIASFAYFLHKNRKLEKGARITKSFFFALAVYALVFCYASILFAIKAFLDFAGLEYESLTAFAPYLYLILIFLGGIALAYLANREYFKAILKERQLLRLAHFELMFILGIALGLHGNTMFRLMPMHIFGFAVTAIAIGLVCLYAMFSNNLADRWIDMVSKKQSSVVNGAIKLKAYEKMSWLFLSAGLFYAAMAGVQTFFTLLLFAGNYFLYSMPPLRLKRVPILSKLLISLNSLALAMLGFVFVTGSLADFPVTLTAIFLIGFTLAINFIDLKDYAGDKKAGIKTLPVMLGMKKAQILTGLFFAAATLSFLPLIPEQWALPLLAVLAVTQFWLINRKTYEEKPVLLVYLLSIAALAVYLIMPV